MLESTRERLLHLSQRGNPAEFLNQALSYIEARPDDAHLRLLAARECLKIGLVRPARDLLEVPDCSETLALQYPSLRARLAGVPDKGGFTKEHQSRFERNLAAVAARDTSLAQRLREAWRRKESAFDVFHDAEGQVQIRRHVPGGGWRFFPCLGNHIAAAEARSLPGDLTRHQPGPYLFYGLDQGWFFARLYRATRSTYLNFSCALFIVEPDTAVLGLVLHLHDWTEVLSDPRVLVFAGDEGMTHLLNTLEADVSLPLPSHVYSRVDTACNAPFDAGAALQTFAEKRAAATLRSWEEVQRQYAGRNAAYWAGRFREALSGGRPLRILAAVSRQTTFLQHSMRDIQRALEALGHRCRVLIEQSDHEVLSALTFHRAIAEDDPDLFLALDHFRPEFCGIVPDNLPMLCWDQDQLPHVLTAANVGGVAEIDFCAGISKPRFVACGGREAQFLYAHVPTSAEPFGVQEIDSALLHRHACDVSYVSHASQTPAAFHDEERRTFADTQLRKLLDMLYEITPGLLHRYRVASWQMTAEALDAACAATGLLIRDEALHFRLTGWYLWRLADRLFRHEALHWAAEWARRSGRSLRIYGRGWEQHPTLHKFAAGVAGNGPDLLAIHRASRINLQLMPAGFVHQRALDGLAGGGFFLARAIPYDLAGDVVEPLIARLDALGLTTSDQLASCRDAELIQLLSRYLGQPFEPRWATDPAVLPSLRILREIVHPVRAFPRFKHILFDDADSFSLLADRFLTDDALRTDIAKEMRCGVLTHYTYEATMQRFLTGMTDWLNARATNT